MTAFLSGVMLIATMALTALALGILYACTRGERPSEFERRQAKQRGESIKEFRRRSRPY